MDWQQSNEQVGGQVNAAMAMVAVACAVWWPWVPLGVEEGWPATGFRETCTKIPQYFKTNPPLLIASKIIQSDKNTP